MDPSAEKKSKAKNADMFGDILAEVAQQMDTMQRYSVSRGGTRRKIVNKSNAISPLNGGEGKLKAKCLIIVMEFLPANRNEFKDILNLITRRGNMFFETYV